MDDRFEDGLQLVRRFGLEIACGFILAAFQNAVGIVKGNLADGVQEEGLGLGRRFLGGPVHAQLEGVHLVAETGGSRGRRGLPGPPGRAGLLGEKLPGAVTG